MNKIETDIADIKSRNKRVEADKAWETSKARKCAIIAITYLCATIVMWWLGIPQPYLNAVIPTMGFYLSTLSIGIVKTYWIRNYYKEDK
jgi:hypothetical protein